MMCRIYLQALGCEWFRTNECRGSAHAISLFWKKLFFFPVWTIDICVRLGFFFYSLESRCKENKLIAQTIPGPTNRELTTLGVNVPLKVFPSLPPPLLSLFPGDTHLPRGEPLAVRPVSNNVSDSVRLSEDPWRHLHALRYCPDRLVSL